ncbi:MAG: DUF2380 domain-containing protein [Chlamydiia bacterium]
MNLTEALDFIEELEAGQWDHQLTSFEEIEVAKWLVKLAIAGVTPDDEARLRESIYSLLCEEISLPMYSPAAFYPNQHRFIRCGGFFHCLKKVGNFIVENRTPILVGGAVVLAGGGTVVLGLAIAEGIRVNNATPIAHDRILIPEMFIDSSPKIAIEPKPAPLVETVSAVQEVKELVASGQIFQDSSGPIARIEVEAIGKYIQERELQSVIGQVESTVPQSLVTYPFPVQNSFQLHSSAMDVPSSYSNIDLYNMCKITIAEGKGLHQEVARGYASLIENHPYNPYFYIGQGSALLQLGRTEEAIFAFDQYAQSSPAAENFGLVESFMRGFVVEMEPATTPEELAFQYRIFFQQGIVLGLARSADGLIHMGKELAIHPIHTIQELFGAAKALVCLTLDREWTEVSRALSPKAVYLAENWNRLNDLERAQIIGEAFGQFGGDFIVCPNLIANAAQRGVKIAGRLTKIANRIKTAESIFTLECISLIEKGGPKLALLKEEQSLIKKVPSNQIFIDTKPIQLIGPLENNFWQQPFSTQTNIILNEIGKIYPEGRPGVFTFNPIGPNPYIQYPETLILLPKTGTECDNFFALAKSGPPTKNTYRTHAIEKSGIPKHVLKEQGRNYPVHHHFPQELEPNFLECGIDNIHKYTDAIPLKLHQEIHARGFNKMWQKFFDSSRTEREIIAQLKNWYIENEFYEMAEMANLIQLPPKV